jgi:predicted metalloprotease
MNEETYRGYRSFRQSTSFRTHCWRIVKLQITQNLAATRVSLQGRQQQTSSRESNRKQLRKIRDNPQDVNQVKIVCSIGTTRRWRRIFPPTSNYTERSCISDRERLWISLGPNHCSSCPFRSSRSISKRNSVECRFTNQLRRKYKALSDTAKVHG